jgi:hypothetical protein
MRLATLIIALVLMLVLGVQSCAVAVGGSIAEELSTAASEKEEASDLAGAGALGVLAALLWLVAAALVIAKPKASMWIFIAAALLCLLGGASGFSDLFVWAAASGVFALMSWRGTLEKRREVDEKQRQYEADVAAAAAQARQPPPPDTPAR